jgi:hypothetical protein
MKTKVLYFPSNTENRNKNYYHIYSMLKAVFGDQTSVSVDAVDKYLLAFDERFYIKELSYQLEIYNSENEYVFCINKPIV